MPWNGPIKGSWENVDYNKGPWANTICDLTHDECVFAITETNKVAEAYIPGSDNGNPGPTDAYILDKYNNLYNWEKPINGLTYDCLKGYNPEVNTLGINENGIVQPEPVEEQPEEGEE